MKLRMPMPGTRLVGFILGCAIINGVLGVIATITKLPIFLDVTGTFIAGIVLGPWWAIIPAYMGGLIIAMSVDPTTPFFILCYIAQALLVGYCAKLGFFKKWYGALITGAVIMPVPISFLGALTVVVVFGGVTGHGVDVVTLALVQTLKTSILDAAFWGYIPINMFSLGLQAMIGWYAVRIMPTKYLTAEALARIGRKVLQQ